MKKKLIIFYPNISNDGCKKTLELYSQYFIKKFNLFLITNTSDLSLLKNINSKVNIINPKSTFFEKFYLLNELYCVFQLFKIKNLNKIVLSLDSHFFLLLLKFFNLNFSLIVRIANPISINKNNFFSSSSGLQIGKVDLILMKFANLVILYNKKHLKILSNNFKIKKTLVIRNHFPKFVVSKKKIKKKYNIFFIGRLVDSKDPIFFLRNCLKINNKFCAKISFVGDGPLMNDLKKLSFIKKSKVKFYNFVKDPFKKLRNKIDIFCLTSKYDGTPNVLGEAISYKIPCLAPKNVGCVDELLNYGEYGETFTKESDKDFSKKINLLLNNYSKAILKSEKAYKALNRYNKKNTLEKLEKKLLLF